MEDTEVVIDSLTDGVEILQKSLQCAIWFVIREACVCNIQDCMPCCIAVTST
jgi:hypothetical protein